MKTHDLITSLTTGLQPAQRHAVGRRLALSVIAGMLVATIAVLLTGGMRPDMGLVLDDPVFWLKSAFPATVAVAGEGCRYDLRFTFANGRAMVYRNIDICRYSAVRIRPLPRMAGALPGQ